LGLQVRELFVGNFVDQGEQVGEAGEDFVVELSGKFYEFHVDEVEG
jgi:hypothetical protein